MFFDTEWADQMLRILQQTEGEKPFVKKEKENKIRRIKNIFLRQYYYIIIRGKS